MKVTFVIVLMAMVVIAVGSDIDEEWAAYKVSGMLNMHQKNSKAFYSIYSKEKI